MKIIPRELQKHIFSYVPRDRLSKAKINDCIKPEIEIYNSLKHIYGFSFIEYSLKSNKFYKYIFRFLFGLSSLTPEQLDIIADLSPTSSFDLEFDSDVDSTTSEF